MYAIEFEAQIKNGVVKIPERYTRVKNGSARVVVLLEEEEELEEEAVSPEQAINFADYPIDTFQEVDGVAWQREQRDAW